MCAVCLLKKKKQTTAGRDWNWLPRYTAANWRSVNSLRPVNWVTSLVAQLEHTSELEFHLWMDETSLREIPERIMVSKILEWIMVSLVLEFAVLVEQI